MAMLNNQRVYIYVIYLRELESHSILAYLHQFKSNSPTWKNRLGECSYLLNIIIMCGRNITCPDLSVPNVEHPPRNHGLVGDETTYLEYSNGAIDLALAIDVPFFDDTLLMMLKTA